MSATVPTREPEVLMAGDTWQWTKTVTDYPPGSGWTLSYSVRGPSVLSNDVVVVAESGSVYSVSVDATKTSPLKAGTYRWAAHVTKDSARYTVDDGVFVVEADLAQITDAGTQPYAEKMLAMVEAVLTGRITADVEQYQIAGRAVTKIPLAELRKLRASCKREIWALQNSGRFGPVIRTRFTRAS